MAIELLVVTKPDHVNYGMVVTVQEEGSRWGPGDDIREWVRQGNHPRAFDGVMSVMKVDGLTVEEAKEKYCGQWVDLEIEPDMTIDWVMKQPRLYRIEMERAEAAGATVERDGVPRASKAVLERLARNQRTGLTERV